MAARAAAGAMAAVGMACSLGRYCREVKFSGGGDDAKLVPWAKVNPNLH